MKLLPTPPVTPGYYLWSPNNGELTFCLQVYLRDTVLCVDCSTRTRRLFKFTRHQSVVTMGGEWCRLEPVDEEVKQKYYQLILAVARKHDNETRHETALRYINEAETPSLPFTATQQNKSPQ